MNFRRELERIGIETIQNSSDDVFISCPFHEEQTPSLEVHIRKGYFYCFGCGESGSWWKLVSKITGLSIEDIKQKYSSVEIEASLENLFSFIEPEEEESLKYFSIKSFHKVFPPVLGTPGEKYLIQKRNIGSGICEKFDLRWGIEGVMENRIVFPIYNEIGKLISYGGRAIDERQPKTRKVTSARSTLFGLWQLIQSRKTDVIRLPYLILVEGEFDAIYLQQYGYKTVAAMGTSLLTNDQFALLVLNSKKVLIAYDADEAGKKAQERQMQELRKHVKTITVDLPPGCDPNDLSKGELNDVFRLFI